MEGKTNARTVENVFEDYKSRRAGLIKALTSDVDKFFVQCDPEMENVCLYGLPNKEWEVNLPAEEVPPEIPEPSLGINFARDEMHDKEWLALVAVHSDSWLLSVAFYFGARFGFGKTERKRLFQMINNLPTVFEVVSGEIVPSKEKSKSSKKTSRQSEYCVDEEEEEADDEEEQAATLCGACGQTYANGEFWICCDICEKWFHGKCVKITPAKAEHIKQYKCPNCNNKKRTRA